MSTNTSFVDFSSTLGLAGFLILSINVLLGLVFVTPVSRRAAKLLKKPRLQKFIFITHKYTGIVGTILVLAHPTILLLNRDLGFTLFNILINSTASPFDSQLNTVGSVALYLIVLIVITSLVMKFSNCNLLPSVGHQLLLSYEPSFGGSLNSLLEYYTDGSYNADPPGELLHNINEQKFEYQLMYSYQLIKGISVTGGFLHHENFRFTDHYFWAIAGFVLTWLPTNNLTISAAIVAEKKTGLAESSMTFLVG